jgi:hypothetical protein
MREILYPALFIGSLLGVTAFALGVFGIGSPPSLISGIHYRDADKLAERGIRMAAAECRGHGDAAKDICMAASAGVDGVRKIELQTMCGERAATLRNECLTASRSVKPAPIQARSRGLSR